MSTFFFFFFFFTLKKIYVGNRGFVSFGIRHITYNY